MKMKRGIFRSSSCFRISCSAGTFLSSGSQTTTAASQPASALRASCGEFDGAGAIDEGEGLAHELHRGDIELDAHAMGPRLGGGITDGRPVGDLALALNGAGPNRMASRSVVLPLRYGPTNAMHRGPLAALPSVSPIAGSSSVATLPREDRPFLSGNRQGGSPHALHARSNRQPWQGDCSPQRSALSSSEATPAATLSPV